MHFALPRSLPRSLSRGIKNLILIDIRFQRFEDLIHLVCELPDLEELHTNAAFDSTVSIELPRRRPRTNRTRLKTVIFSHEAAPFHGLVLYRSVYDEMSFYSEGEIAVVLALLQLSRGASPSTLVARYEHDSCNNSRRLGVSPLCLLISILAEWFCRDNIVSTDFKDSNETILDLQILRDPAQNPTTVLVIVDFRYTDIDEERDRWTRLDREFNKISSQMRQAKFVFGFDDREEMTHFATNILAEKMPSIYRLASVRYNIHIDDDNVYPFSGQWFQASLDSEELTGTPFLSRLSCERANRLNTGTGEEDLAKAYS